MYRLNEESTLKFVEEYRQRPCLWDTTSLGISLEGDQEPHENRKKKQNTGIKINIF